MLLPPRQRMKHTLFYYTLINCNYLLGVVSLGDSAVEVLVIGFSVIVDVVIGIYESSFSE